MLYLFSNELFLNCLLIGVLSPFDPRVNEFSDICDSTIPHPQYGLYDISSFIFLALLFFFFLPRCM